MVNGPKANCTVHCPIHPTISTVGLIIPVALLVSWSGWLEFSVISNLAFTIAGIYQEFQSRASHEKTALLKAAPTILALMGASSFVFHLHFHKHSHILDIFFGWCLALHGATSALGCAMTLGLRQRGIKSFFLAVAMPFTIFSVCLHIIIGYYIEIYNWQIGYYSIMAGVIFVAGVVVRVDVIRRDIASLQRRAWSIAIVEVSSILVLALSALFVQSQQAGVQFAIYSDEYDLYHGMWHIQLAIAFSMLYTRLLDGVSTTAACIVSSITPLDISALVSVWVLASGTLLLKELRAPLLVTHVFLAWIGLAFLAIACTHWSFEIQSVILRITQAKSTKRDVV